MSAQNRTDDKSCYQEGKSDGEIADLIRRLLAWADERWNAEVANRPDGNIHKRALDTTWRQVRRKLEAEAAALERQQAAPAAQPAPPLGWRLAMRVLQSDLYRALDESERDECDALIHAAQPAQPDARAAEPRCAHIRGTVTHWCELAADGEAARRAGFAEAREQAARIADGFHCGSCGMDGKTAAAIRAMQPEAKEGGES